MANTKITNPELFNLGASTSATQLPVMTTTQRTATTGLSVGEMIFNSTTDKVEYFDGTKWYGITYEENPCFATDPDTSLVLYLDAANINSFDQATNPNTWYGLGSATSNNASNVNLATFNATTVNYLANFGLLNGGGNFGIVPNNTNLYWAQNRSISVWVKITSLNNNQGIVSKFNNTTPYGWVLSKESANLAFTFYVSQTGYKVIWNMTSKLNQWMQVTVTYSTSLLSLYVDGVYKNAIATSATPQNYTGNVRIGRFYDLFSGYALDGYVSEVKMWSKWLSQTEVTAEFDRKKACFGL